MVRAGQGITRVNQKVRVVRAGQGINTKLSLVKMSHEPT
jgi:hypothetical protein